MRNETWAEISLDKLNHNYQSLSNQIGDRSVFPVVKANAYGHGMIEMAKAFEQMGAQILCVSAIEEAVKLVESGISVDILIFGRTSNKAIQKYHHPQFIYTISSIAWLNEIEKPVRLHLEINTGMNRMGIKLKSEIFQVLKNHKVEGIYTHFASNTENQFTQRQLMNFKQIIAEISLSEIKWIHVGNIPLAYLEELPNVNGVRFGLSLYGYHPYLPLEPVLSLYSKISHIDYLSEGETVGYDYTYIANKDEIFATVPIGYADGFDLRQKLYPVYIKGNAFPIIGKICMDQLMIRGNQSIQVDDTVELIGEHRELDAVSFKTGLTIYEVLSRLPERLQRKYIKFYDEN